MLSSAHEVKTKIPKFENTFPCLSAPLGGYIEAMKIESLHIGMRVRHPQYGEGMVQALNTATAEIQFGQGTRTVAPESSGLQPSEAQAALERLEMPLQQLLEQTVNATIEKLGLEKPESAAIELGSKWQKGRLVLHPGNSAQPKEVPLESFFHKVVMVRNQLRVLEQKINAHEKLSDAEKVEMQQYITRCYGSLTTFNVLFKDKEGEFKGSKTD